MKLVRYLCFIFVPCLYIIIYLHLCIDFDGVCVVIIRFLHKQIFGLAHCY